MCGIAGNYRCGGPDTARRMADALAHRGPDDEGTAWFPEVRVGLGHRRLSIIDLSSAGHQPMSLEDGTLWLTFNGEIYNFRELASRLRARGHRFRSRTDTEVVLAQYKEHGPAGIADLNGMFAFALLDLSRRSLLLARDHVGVKPLFCWTGGGRLLFASEIKAILASGEYSPEVDWQAVRDYFTYLYVPGPQTAFRDIWQVEPGTFVEVDLDSGELRTTRYYRPDADAGDSQRDGPHETDVRALLAESVARQMVSDVPIGAFLSGGIDSAVLTGLMAQASPTPIKTFTAVFDAPELADFDERDRARIVARRYGTDHHELPVRLGTPNDMLEVYRRLDQPFGNPTFYLMYLISRAARAETKVALSGAGGDELFGGYPRYRAAQLARWLDWCPRPLTRLASSALAIPADGYRSGGLRRARRFFEGLEGDRVRQFMKWTYFYDEAEKDTLLRPLAGHEVGSGARAPAERWVRGRWDGSAVADAGSRYLHVDTETFLVDNLLAYTDRMSMAVSLEVRVPILDPEVVRRSLRIPLRDNLGQAGSKRVLKGAFRDLIPAELMNAPKRGFNVPLGIWMLGELDGYFEHRLDRARVARDGIFDWQVIERLRHDHRRGRQDRSYYLFAVIAFDLWFRQHILSEDAQVDVPLAVG